MICVGIIFSVVVPLFLYVNKLNNLYNQTFLETSEIDRQRSMESITVFAYPTAGNTINVYIRNKCPLNVKVMRIWITDLDNKTAIPLNGSSLLKLPLPLLLTPGNDTIVPVPVSSLKLGGRVNIDVTTERGKVYASETNTLAITPEGEWEFLPYAIDVAIESTGEGRKRYAVKAEQYESGHPIGWNNTILISVVGFAQASIGVPTYGDYNLTVYREGQSAFFFTRVVKVPLFGPVVITDKGK